ncbi:MAG: cardiolipin synthase [Kiritimatiellia bacterium]
MITVAADITVPVQPDVPLSWFPLWSILHILTFVLVTAHCLTRRREATSAILWIFVAWSFPVIGPLFFVFFGINRVPAKSWYKHRSNEEFLNVRKKRESDMELAYWKGVHEAVSGEALPDDIKPLNDTMSAVLPEYPLLGGNSIDALVTGDEAFPRMLEAIGSARDHVHVQTFIAGNDQVGRRLMEALKAKAEEGVRVRFLYDRFGSTWAVLGGLFRKYRSIPNLRLAGWTQANFIKKQFAINLRNHRKILIVDGKKAFLGGINFCANNVTGASRPPDRDYHFQVTGPIVQELQYSFLRDWYFMTDDSADSLLVEKHFPPIDPSGSAKIRIVNGEPTQEIEDLTDTLFACIGSARRQLLAVTPYLIPTRDIMRAFRAASLRGVDVRLIVPAKSNHLYAGMAGRALYEDFLEAGIRIFERPMPFIHAKAVIVDSSVAVVGTANLDVRSLRLNYETNLVIYDEDFVGRLKQIVYEDMHLSEELDLNAWRRRPIYRQVAENFCNLLTPVL